MRMLALLSVASGVFAGQDCDADHVSALQMQTLRLRAESEETSSWFLFGEVCKGFRSVGEDDCHKAASQLTKRSRARIVPEWYSTRRKEGCYKFKGVVWWNSPMYGITDSLLTEGDLQWNSALRGRATVCSASQLKIKSGEVCFNDAIATQFGGKNYCKYAARRINWYQGFNVVPSKYQSKRPEGCYHYKGEVWWNPSKLQNPNANHTTKRGRETICFPESLDLEVAAKFMSGEVCFDDAVATQFGGEAYCSHAAQWENENKKISIVPLKYQRKRPEGCYKYRGKVWWNPKKLYSHETRTTKRWRETVCFPAAVEDEDAAVEDEDAAVEDEDAAVEAAVKDEGGKSTP